MTSRLISYDVRIWEKAEHWTFDTKVEAKDDADAWRVVAKAYPKRSYSVQDIRRS